MHTTLKRLASLNATVAVVLSAGLTLRASAQQEPVRGVTTASGVVQRAQLLLQRQQRDSATTLLSMHVAVEPTDGRAWFFLGRIYLENAREWHRAGHPPEVSGGSVFVDMAGSSFEPAQELLTDSGGVFRVVAAMEQATLRIEASGWEALASWKPASEELPLPPVMAELGRNLLASCPKNGVLVTGTSVVEAAAVWGIRLQGDRDDLVVIRPDMYQWDRRYRGRMAAAIGADSASELAPALAAAARSRPICLGPSVDSIALPGLQWSRSWLVLSTAATVVPAAQFSVFRLSRTGLTGSVWTAAARDEYDLAARRNHALCSTLFVTSYSSTAPAIPACSP
ncbi:MAG: hypothetical protein ABUL71_03400 [Gemmatimonadota bacterium]